MGQVGTSGTGTSSIVGTDLVPGQGKASSVGIWLVPWEKERSFLTFPSPSWDKLCLSHWDKHSLSQSASDCPTGTGCACPSGLSQWDKPGTGTTLPKSALDQVQGDSLSKNQRGPNRISGIPYQKSVWNWSKILTKNRQAFSWCWRHSNSGRKSLQFITQRLLDTLPLPPHVYKRLSHFLALPVCYLSLSLLCMFCSVRTFSHCPCVSQKYTEIYHIILCWEILEYTI